MSELNEYIEYLQIKTENYNELETIRFVYLDLGAKVSFDLFFALGSTEVKRKIYKDIVYSDASILKSFITKKINCKSLSYLLEYILKKLGINARSITSSRGIRGAKHVYNEITLQNGQIINIDLEDDLKNINMHMQTVNFAQNILTSAELEALDTKIGYITSEYYYTNEYLYFLLSQIRDFKSTHEKVTFILENIDVYVNMPSMGYHAIYWYFEKIFDFLLNGSERLKVSHTLVFNRFNKEEAYLIISSLRPYNVYDYYIYNRKSNTFNLISKEALLELMTKGYQSADKIPNLKRKK